MTKLPEIIIPDHLENETIDADFNNTILQLTQTVEKVLGKKAAGLATGAGITILTVNSTPLLSATAKYIRIAALKDVGRLMKTRADLPPPPTKPLDQEAFQAVMNALSSHIIRLNKLGIEYAPDDIETELAILQEIAPYSKGIHLYEEKSDNPKETWLSMGNTDNWQDPLLEIVLSKKNGPHEPSPGFLMDFDTNLSFEELKALIEPIYGPNFFQWQLDIPEVGIVLGIGTIADINGKKITLGFGTKLRNTKWHREHLKLLQ